MDSLENSCLEQVASEARPSGRRPGVACDRGGACKARAAGLIMGACACRAPRCRRLDHKGWRDGVVASEQ